MKKRLDESDEVTFPVYDYVPENKVIKFIILGDVKATPFNTKTSEGREITVTIDLWAENRGMLEIKKMLFIAQDLLSEDLLSEHYTFIYHGTIVEEIKRESPELIHGKVEIIYRVEMIREE